MIGRLPSHAPLSLAPTPTWHRRLYCRRAHFVISITIAHAAALHYAISLMLRYGAHSLRLDMFWYRYQEDEAGEYRYHYCHISAIRQNIISWLNTHIDDISDDDSSSTHSQPQYYGSALRHFGRQCKLLYYDEADVISTLTFIDAVTLPDFHMQFQHLILVIMAHADADCLIFMATYDGRFFSPH